MQQIKVIRGPIGCTGIAVALMFECFAVIPISIIGLVFYVVPGIIAFIVGTMVAVALAVMCSGKLTVSSDENWMWNGKTWVRR